MRGARLERRRRDCLLIALPFYLKPPCGMPGKHRKRAAIRRQYWGEIGAAARGTLERKLKRTLVRPAGTVALRESGEASIPAAAPVAAPH